MERHPYSAAQLARIRDELEAELFAPDAGLAVSMGLRVGQIDVHLRASAEPVARRLQSRYGDAVKITVGALPYPLRSLDACPPRPEATVGVDGLELRLQMSQESVPSGQDASGRILVRNTGADPLELETGQPMVGVMLDGEDRVVGVYTEAIVGTGLLLHLAPTEEASVPAIVGTASCSSAAGYLLPPGRYSAVVPLEVYGNVPPDGGRIGVLVPPPVPLLLT